MQNKKTALLLSAMVLGLTMGSAAKADHHEPKKSPAPAKTEKKSCGGAHDAKNDCPGHHEDGDHKCEDKDCKHDHAAEATTPAAKAKKK